MNINFKNIVICLIIILCISLIFSVAFNVLKNEELKTLIKSESLEILKDESIYGDLEIVLNKYIESLKNYDYNKLKDMSDFFASQDNICYNNLNNRLNLKDTNNIDLNSVYILSKDIYKCNVVINDLNCVICIKLDDSKKYFRVLDFIV